MEAQGFVSKIDQIGKADYKEVCPRRRGYPAPTAGSGIMIHKLLVYADEPSPQWLVTFGDQSANNATRLGIVAV
jgi:hypothetical protein